jgi:Beta-galactosidase
VKPARCLLVLGALLFSAQARAWDDYQIIQWQPRDQSAYEALKRLGVTAGKVMANRDGTATPVGEQYAPMLAAGLPWYVENIATDFYAAYHRWFPDRPVNWWFVAAQRRLRQDPDDQSVFWRNPSFADPVWQRRIRDRLIATVHEESRFHPLFYNLGDETGIADLTAFFDFDLSPGSLEGMRIWLRQNYGSLDALNAEWGTHFVRWEDVRPETTRQAMRRTDDNFAAWSDFKAWMDLAFARALRMGTDAVHEADPSALAGIEGVQIPGWGGYDYSLLVGAVDVMELDDLPLAHSLNPGLITITTAFGGAPKDIHAIWRNLLAGSRGLGLWDPKNAIVREDTTLGERGRAYADTFAEIRGGIGALLLASEPQLDPVAIFYSPASFRVQWMLEQKPQGDAWMDRDSETELHSNAARDAMWAYRHAVAHLGLQPSYVSSLGGLPERGFKALILPHAIALSPDDARAVRGFAAAGGLVIADVPPGVFDSHGRRQPQPLLDPGAVRLIAPRALDTASLGVSPRMSVEAELNDVTIHTWRRGTDTIIGVQRDFAPNATDETVVLNLPQSAEIYDLRKQQALGRTDRVVLTLDAIFPALLSVAAK